MRLPWRPKSLADPVTSCDPGRFCWLSRLSPPAPGQEKMLMRLERDRYAAKVCFLLVGWPFDVCICTYIYAHMYIYIYMNNHMHAYSTTNFFPITSYNLFPFGVYTFTHADTHIPEQFGWDAATWFSTEM
jgi:hypothetical protein